MPRMPDLAYLDYFLGGVPPGPLFSINLADVEGVLRSARIPAHGLDPQQSCASSDWSPTSRRSSATTSRHS